MSAVKTIYAGLRALRLEDEDDRRDLYQRITGKRRLREMSPGDKENVVAELRRLGFRNPKSRRLLDGPYAKKLQALWISAWNLGLVRNRDDSALIAFVKRQTGLDSPRWLRDPDSAEKAVEALKDWLRRDGGVLWGNVAGAAWLKDHGAKIAWAQWCKLHPDASLADPQAFAAKIAAALGRPAVKLDCLTSADWKEASRALGVTIRASRST